VSAIAAGLKAILARIDAVSEGRPVTLVAVSKTHPEEAVREALDAGHRVFGENRVQEAKAKFPGLKTAFPDLELHLIGPLQTNKVRDAVALFDVIETIDRPKLARAVADEMVRTGRRPRVLIQVNTGHEPQKAGVDPDQVDAMVAVCRDQYGLPLAGLMCIPPADQDPAPHFRLLASMAARHGLGVVSMGMSGDFETAVAEGATHVRVGSAIFGHRG
jgi:pyridoxal phosphate enzyme (YggS family)